MSHLPPNKLVFACSAKTCVSRNCISTSPQQIARCTFIVVASTTFCHVNVTKHMKVEGRRRRRREDGMVFESKWLWRKRVDGLMCSISDPKCSLYSTIYLGRHISSLKWYQGVIKALVFHFCRTRTSCHKGICIKGFRGSFGY